MLQVTSAASCTRQADGAHDNRVPDDAQVNQLHAIARQETSKLRESSNADQYTGSAAAARQEAIQQIRSAIGAQKSYVGLTTPQVQDFAARLAQLSGTQLTHEQFAEYLKHKTDTKSVKLARAVTVELRYDTITVENGKLHIYRDVYERGTNTEENLRAVLQSNGVSFDDSSDGARTGALRALNAMSRNAGGKPVTESNSKSAKNKDSTGKVTRLIKGAKEAVINIPELAGKGYPAAVDLDTGVPPKTQTPRARKRR